MTLSLVAVFIPVLFMGGIVGTSAARVRGRDLCCDPCVGRGFADIDADACEPLPPPHTVAAKSTASSTSGRSVSSTKSGCL